MTTFKIQRSLEELRSRYTPQLRACEVCSSDKFILLQSNSRKGSALNYGINQTLICSRCSYKMQNPRYPNEFYKEYYSEVYREICFGFLAPDQDYIDDQIERGGKVLEYCKKFFPEPGVVLDHGSASGGALIPFKEKGWEVLGVDPHEESVNSGRNELGLDVRKGVGEKLPFASNTVDFIMSLGSLEHSYDIGLTLKEAKRVLKDDSGILFIRWRSDKLWGSPMEYYNHNHYRFFTDSTIKLLLLKYGFEVIDKTKIEIEQKPGEVYTIAKANKEINKDEFEDNLNNYERKNLSITELSNHISYRSDYLIRCRNFLEKWENANGDYDAFAKEIRSDKTHKHRILLGKPKWAVDRAVNEAKLYIENWSKGKIF